jgi:melibiase-like protein
LVGVTRTVEAYPGIAGFESRTSVTPLAPLVVSGYVLDQLAAGADVTPTVHAFRAGADWREPGWKPRSIGDPHTGDWHVSASAAQGQKLTAPGEWLSLADPADHRTFLVTERRDYSSSRMSYDGSSGASVVDLSRDVIYIGPFEETAHIENPGAGPARHRAFLPGSTVELEPVFSGFGTDGDDEPWQYYRYLTEHRLAAYPKAVTFNTNPIDANAISTGAKDDVNFDRFVQLADAARAMGVDTFIFDDGWQAASGDWCPDSPQCPEPRWDGVADSKFRPRFPDDHFEAVRQVLAGDPSDPSDDIALGLWMNPMEFNPASKAFKTNPQWSCVPVGTGTAAVNLAQPDDGSNEAGIGVWNPEALGLDPDTKQPVKFIDYLEGRVRRAIDVYGARYFKFDFLVWSDCGGAYPVDMYGYRDSFVRMLDRLQADHPDVTFEIDETNDYRLFPFESVARGPSWFQNGSPQSAQLLHNIWNLAPYVPGFSLGQHALGNRSEVAAHGIDSLMAVALGSHITFWTDIDAALTPAQRAEVKRWTDFYKANRGEIASFTYPLLDDPLSGGWAALQPWNPDAGTGFLLAYRQGAANDTQTIPLRGVRGSGSFALTLVDPATGSATALGTFTASALRQGLDVTIAQPFGYAIVQIHPI